jgi:hypothetical protein
VGHPEQAGQPPANLVLLHIAVRMVYAAVYHRRDKLEAVTHERLSGIAQCMAALVPLYIAGTTHTMARRLSQEDLAGAIVRRGGTEIHFTDGRPALLTVCVSRTGIGHVIALLEGAWDEVLPSTPEERAKLFSHDAR